MVSANQPRLRSHRADPEVVPLADRHYNRQKIGSPQFAPPGRCLVLKDLDPKAGRHDEPMPACSFFCEIAEQEYSA